MKKLSLITQFKPAILFFLLLSSQSNTNAQAGSNGKTTSVPISIPVSAVSFPKEVIPVNAGKIDFWAKLSGYSGSISVGGIEPYFFILAENQNAFEMGFNSNDGRGNGGLSVYAGKFHWGGTGFFGSYTYEQVLGAGQVSDWHHYVFQWNKNGIPGVSNGQRNVAAFIDGVLNSSRWDVGVSDGFPAFSTCATLNLITVGNQGVVGGEVAIDEFKIFDGNSNLVLYNTLGSANEIAHSIVGLNGTFNGGGSAHFVPGIAGNAVMANPVYSMGNSSACSPSTPPCVLPYGSATFTKTDATCAGTATGSITILPTVGLVSDYTYKLHYSDPYVASNVFNNLKSGIYHGYALRNGGCVYRAGLITVNNSNVPMSATTSKTDATCKGACDGTITVTASGGSGHYLYQLGSAGTPQSPRTFTGLCAGTYRVIITDSAGCSKPFGISVTIAQPTTPCGNNIIPLSGLRLWLKADAGITKNSSNLVSQWNDQSGNNYIATQANNDTMPLWVDNASNGKPFLRFNGTSDFFRTNFKGMGGTELTFFIVAKGSNLQSIIRLQTQHFNGNGDPNIVYPYTLSDSSFGFIVQDPPTNSISNIPSGLPNNTLAIGCARYKANVTNGMQTFVNQTMFAQTTPSTTLPYEPLYIGQYNGNGLGGTQFTNGDVAEIIIYNRAVNETERENITNYLMTKYGITAKSNNKLNYAKPELPFSQDKKITIYPNPTTDRFTLQLSNYKPGKAEIVLANESGQIVERRSINISSLQSNTMFTIDKKATGIYFVKVITAEGVQVRKVVIQDR